MALGGLKRTFERFLCTFHSIRVGASPSGPLIEADSTRVKVPGLTLGSTAITATPAQINLLAATTGVPVQAALVSLTETTGAGTYTGSITVPAGALIHDVKAWSTALWTATTSATLKVGDAADDDGWFTGVDLKATDLLVGEELNFIQTGGKEGAYLSLTTGARTKAYSASARVVSFIVTTVGAAGNAGRSFGAVIYSLPTATAATKA